MTFTFLAVAGAAVAGLATAFATPAVRQAALRRGWADRPDGHRKIHDAPTASAGGLAIAFGVGVGLSLVHWAAPILGVGAITLPVTVYVGALVVIAVGLYDDVRGLGFKAKLTVETLLAILLVAAGYKLDLTSLALFASNPGISVPITLLWIVGVMNAVNLIDGVDGLAAGVAAIAFLSMSAAFGLAGENALALIALIFVGALVGFLIHNFSPASIFMGDSGSLFLGYAIAVYSLSAPMGQDPKMALATPILALGLPLLDTVLSMIRRVVGRKTIFAPDRDHIHHRMVDRLSVRKAVVVLYAISALFGVLALLVSFATWTGITVVLVVAASVVIALLTRLGYMRLPYVSPRIAVAGVAETNQPEVSLANSVQCGKLTGGTEAPDLVPSSDAGGECLQERLRPDPDGSRSAFAIQAEGSETRDLITKQGHGRRFVS